MHPICFSDTIPFLKYGSSGFLSFLYYAPSRGLSYFKVFQPSYETLWKNIRFRFFSVLKGIIHHDKKVKFKLR